MATKRMEAFQQDSGMTLQDAGLVAASAAGTTILDLGAHEMGGTVVLDVSALEIATDDESYTIFVTGSPDAAFGTAANIQELCSIQLGAAPTKLSTSDKDDVVGRYVLGFSNMAAGTVYRYVRLYILVAGTIATGINFSAFLAKDN